IMKFYVFLFVLLFLGGAVLAEKNWHYDCDFGMHYDLHAGFYDTELGAGITHENLKETLMIIRPDWVQCDCKGHAGYTSWPTEMGNMSPGVVKDALRIHSDVCHELGIKLGMHYSGVFDILACEKHPEWEAVNYDGKRHNHPVLRSVCQNSPYYDELMIPQMLELIDKYDVDGFWIDGDGWGLLPCYCDKCRKGFTDRYGIEPPTDVNDPNWHKWAFYHRELFMANVQKYCKAVHDRKPECLCISNWMYTYACPIDETFGTDYISGDLNPYFGQMSALLESHFLTNRQRDWDLMCWGFMTPDSDRGLIQTKKNLPHILQESALILAGGGGVMQYDNPLRNGLITDYSSRNYGKVRDFVKARASVSRHSRSVPQIALVQSPNDYFDDTKIYPNLYDYNILQPFMARGVGASQLLSETHYHFDILTPNMLKGRMKDFSLIVIAENYRFEEDFKKDLREYAENGGKVLIAGVNSAKVFGEILGCEDTGKEFLGQFYAESGDETVPLEGPLETVNPGKAEVFRYALTTQYAKYSRTDIPFITVNSFGKGTVAGIYSDFFTSYAHNMFPNGRELFAEIMERINPDRILEKTEAPSYVFFNLREKDDCKIVNIVNTGSVSSSIGRPYMVDDIPSVSEINFRLKLEKKPGKVYLVPGEADLKTDYKDGYLSVTVNNFGIMESLVIK
ncbi:MAG: alpha-L-fucosidase, partial [Armatimonadetes bacterium]|nr:alpha-L-fucosidase [Candidatus Hippobium faecium]